MNIEWKHDASAFLISLFPIALPTEDVVPPPMAPPDIININIWNGKTSANTASDSVPRKPIKNASAKVAIVQKSQAIPLGSPNLHNIDIIEPLSISDKFEMQRIS